MGLFDSIFRQAENALKNEANKAAYTPAGAGTSPAQSSAKTRSVTISALPSDAQQMKSMPEFTLNDPDKVAVFAIAALNRYSSSREDSKEMLNVLKGPEPLSNREIQFINGRFMDGKDYVTRSYFLGSSPDNDYTASAPYTVEIVEYANSRENEGYLRLFVKSSGADSPRPLVLRHKPSTDEWFLWEFAGVLSGVRIPKSTDKWA